MSNGGKGDDRRPLSVDEATFASNWDRIFASKSFSSVPERPKGDDSNPSSDLTVAAVGSNPTTAATYARFENDGLHVDLNAYLVTKEGREKFASLLGKKPIYIDNATG